MVCSQENGVFASTNVFVQKGQKTRNVSVESGILVGHLPRVRSVGMANVVGRAVGECQHVRKLVLPEKFILDQLHGKICEQGVAVRRPSDQGSFLRSAQRGEFMWKADAAFLKHISFSGSIIGGKVGIGLSVCEQIPAVAHHAARAVGLVELLKPFGQAGFLVVARADKITRLTIVPKGPVC